ncbi:MAG: TonB-dependent receptor [Chlorobium sp.]
MSGRQVRARTKRTIITCNNISSAVISGLEFETSIAMGQGFSVAANADWMDTENKDTCNKLEGKPDISAYLKLGYNNIRHDLHANLRASYFGNRFYTAGDESGYSLVNAYVSKGITEKMGIFAGIDKIFDESDSEPVFFYC